MPELHDPELMTVGPDEVVVTFRTDDDTHVLTTVGDRSVTTTGCYHSACVAGLEAGRRYALHVDDAPASDYLPAAITTLPRPDGALLATVATTNDVHFGETVCGLLDVPDGSEPLGPTFSSAPGEPPYPQTMNRAAIAEIEALDPDVVLVKGDLTDRGTRAEYDDFLAAYGVLGQRMRHVRGNHDAMVDPDLVRERAPFAVELDGVALAVLDTTRPGTDRGGVDPEQLAWLDELAARSERVLVFGHHHPWDPASVKRSADYFGINPDDSEALLEVIARRPSIGGYFAGHTHRNRVRRFPSARRVPIVEVACVKDYPGAWAEYRIHEGGYTQLVRRIAAPDAMAWTERTRGMFGGLYRDYALGRLDDRCFTEPFARLESIDRR